MIRLPKDDESKNGWRGEKRMPLLLPDGWEWVYEYYWPDCGPDKEYLIGVRDGKLVKAVRIRGNKVFQEYVDEVIYDPNPEVKPDGKSDTVGSTQEGR